MTLQMDGGRSESRVSQAGFKSRDVDEHQKVVVRWLEGFKDTAFTGLGAFARTSGSSSICV